MCSQETSNTKITIIITIINENFISSANVVTNLASMFTTSPCRDSVYIYQIQDVELTLNYVLVTIYI